MGAGNVRLIGIYIAWLLDVLGLKRLSRAWFAKLAGPEHPPYVVYVAAKAFISQGEIEKAKSLLAGSMMRRPSVRCGRLLMHLFIRSREYDRALEVAATLCEKSPQSPWPYLLLGDVYNFFLGCKEDAYQSYLRALEIARSGSSGVNPLKVAYKRICLLLKEQGNEDQLVEYLSEFLKLQASNFHDNEFVLLTRGLMRQGRTDEAKEVLSLGVKAYPRSGPLRELWETLGFGRKEELPPMPVRGKAPPSSVRLVPVRTRLFLEGEDPVQAMQDYVRDVAPGDIATLSSCVAGLMEGRIFMEGAVEPGFLARTLSRFVDQKNVPFGGAAPMSNPLSMQVLLEEIGSLRTLVAAFAGGLGKILGKKGWFYVIGGKDAGQIDDVLGSLPPYDYYVIMGPEDPCGLARRIASALGCEAAIVDANDLGVAWAVGYSDGVDPRWLEQVMSTNPAGNQEQQTPIVLVRKVPEIEASEPR